MSVLVSRRMERAWTYHVFGKTRLFGVIEVWVGLEGRDYDKHKEANVEDGRDHDEQNSPPLRVSRKDVPEVKNDHNKRNRNAYPRNQIAVLELSHDFATISEQ